MAAFKVEAVAVGEGGVVISKETANLRMLRESLGLSEAHLTQVFPLGGRHFTLVGFKNTGCAKPFIVKCVEDGGSYVLTRDAVMRALSLAG